MTMLLGIDPAADGAAVLARVDESPMAVLSVWSWKLVQRNFKPAWRVTRWCPGWRVGLDENVATPGLIGREIAWGLAPYGRPAALVVEGAYVGKNPLSAVRIARFGGFVSGGIQAAMPQGLPLHAVEISPSAWRGQLGIGARDRATAKARSLAGVPSLVPSIRPALAALGQLDHVTDATGLALAGALLRAWEPGLADRLEAAHRRGR